MHTPDVRDHVTERVIGAFFDVYNTLRFGFLEAVYANSLALVLRRHGMRAEREFPVTVRFRGEPVGSYRVDLLVERRLVVEVKATKALDPSARFQTLHYLRATGLPIALLLHFGPQASFQRIVLTPRGARRDTMTDHR